MIAGTSLPRCLLVLIVTTCVGCQTQTSSPPPKKNRASESSQLNTFDSCASRLHDISGPLLLYYATNRHLPPSLDELKQVGGFGDLEYKCPVSGMEYIYLPKGIPTPNQPGARIILYDAAPSHQGMRWAVSITEPPDRSSGALVTKVIAVPDSYFTKNG
jgi:hypothetical protein